MIRAYDSCQPRPICGEGFNRVRAPALAFYGAAKHANEAAGAGFFGKLNGGPRDEDSVAEKGGFEPRDSPSLTRYPGAPKRRNPTTHRTGYGRESSNVCDIGADGSPPQGRRHMGFAVASFDALPRHTHSYSVALSQIRFVSI
jgi:hypothetical protein